jgi:hypothetical protein
VDVRINVVPLCTQPVPNEYSLHHSWTITNQECPVATIWTRTTVANFVWNEPAAERGRISVKSWPNHSRQSFGAAINKTHQIGGGNLHFRWILECWDWMLNHNQIKLAIASFTVENIRIIEKILNFVSVSVTIGTTKKCHG